MGYGLPGNFLLQILQAPWLIVYHPNQTGGGWLLWVYPGNPLLK